MATLQIKNVPEDVHAQLRERAKAQRTTMRDYVLGLIENDLRLASLSEWAKNLRERGPLATDLDPDAVTRAIQKGREERDADLADATGGADRPRRSGGGKRRR